MLTKTDQQNIEKLVRTVVKDEVKHLPTKGHFDKRMDELLGEVQTMRDEQTLHQGQHDEITDRLDRLDKHTNLPSA